MIADLSEREIQIDERFAGKDVLLYGTRIEAGDMLVALRGEPAGYMVRKKEPIWGVWVNTKSVVFKNVPNFYWMASSRPMSRIEAPMLMKRLQIGLSGLDIAAKPSGKGVDIETFKEALFASLEKDGFYSLKVFSIPFLEETLFSLRPHFPEKIKRGVYTAEIYSVDDGRVQGMQSIPLEVKKIGMEAVIFDAAHRYPALYGALSVAVALAAGWLAGTVFRKV